MSRVGPLYQDQNASEGSFLQVMSNTSTCSTVNMSRVVLLYPNHLRRVKRPTKNWQVVGKVALSTVHHSHGACPWRTCCVCCLCEEYQKESGLRAFRPFYLPQAAVNTLRLHASSLAWRSTFLAFVFCDESPSR